VHFLVVGDPHVICNYKKKNRPKTAVEGKSVNMNNKLMLILCFIVAMNVCISSTAMSECAWVLWTKKELFKKTMEQNVYWKLINAYPDYDKCFQEKTRIWQIIRNRALEDKKNSGTISEIREVPDELVITRFKDPKSILSVSEELYCLPGTLDPRERK
jgi:hypothetical protein